MELLYTRYKFYLHFTDPIFFNVEPNFIFRSVIGKHLHDICCIRKKIFCKDCSLSESCGYAILFETPIKHDSFELKGRSSGTHPYVMTVHKPDGSVFFLDDTDNGDLKDFIIEVVAFELAIPSFSYFFTALYNAGKEGLFKERRKYVITSIETKIETYYPSGDSIRISPFIEKWESDLEDRFEDHKLEIKFLTPFRYVENGSISEPINGFHLINSANRRMRILTELYGHNYVPFLYDKKFLTEPYIRVTERKLTWKESSRFSAKQKSLMLLGGVVGNMQLEGRFTKSMIDMIDGVSIFHIGKNTAFGFGKLEVKKE